MALLDRLADTIEQASGTRRRVLVGSAAAGAIAFLDACMSGPQPKGPANQDIADDAIPPPELREVVTEGVYNDVFTWKRTDVLREDLPIKTTVQASDKKTGELEQEITIAYDKQGRPKQSEWEILGKLGELTTYERYDNGALRQVTTLTDTSGNGVYGEIEVMLFEKERAEGPWEDRFWGPGNAHLSLGNNFEEKGTWERYLAKFLRGQLSEDGTITEGDIISITSGNKGRKNERRVYQVDRISNGRISTPGLLINNEEVTEVYGRNIRLQHSAGLRLRNGTLETRSQQGTIVWFRQEDGRVVRIDRRQELYETTAFEVSCKVRKKGRHRNTFHNPDYPTDELNPKWWPNLKKVRKKRKARTNIDQEVSIIFDEHGRQLERLVREEVGQRSALKPPSKKCHYLQQTETALEEQPQQGTFFYLEQYHRNDDGQIVQVSRTYFSESGSAKSVDIMLYAPSKKDRTKQEEQLEQIDLSKRRLLKRLTGTVGNNDVIITGKIESYRRRKDPIVEEIFDGQLAIKKDDDLVEQIKDGKIGLHKYHNPRNMTYRRNVVLQPGLNWHKRE